MSLSDLFSGGNRPSARYVFEHELESQLRPLKEQLEALWQAEEEVRQCSPLEMVRGDRERHEQITELTDRIEALESEEGGGSGESVVTGAEPAVRQGTDVLFEYFSGRRVTTRRREASHPVKTDVWVVNDLASGYRAGDGAWANATALTYEIGRGSTHNGISGMTFRDNHPLKCIGTAAGAPVYLEDLLEMHPEFARLIRNGYSDFDGAKEAWTDLGRLARFFLLVRTGAKYDLKNRDKTSPDSYAAVTIGEWSLNQGRLRRYDDYGNISYGVFGNYAGISDERLIRESDNNQQRTSAAGGTSGGDEYRDVYMMNLGIRRQKNGYY